MNTEPAPDVVARIDALLPQTQCTRCGYPGCRPYAAAIAGGAAEINQCPPGGAEGIARAHEAEGNRHLPRFAARKARTCFSASSWARGS